MTAPGPGGDDPSAPRDAGPDRSDAAPEPPAAAPAVPVARTIPEAQARRGRWIGLVWAVPLAALAIVAFLGARGLADRGIDVVVTFDTGSGARVDDTKVIYQGVEAGHVTKIEINEDGRRVDMSLRLDPRADQGLTSTTRFWLVGANPSLNDISSVKAALAGVTIGVAPGVGGTKPARRFIGLNEPPVVMPGTPGTAYVLTADRLATASVGSSIYYHGQQIGRVTSVRFVAAEDFRIDIFVFAPYDNLVHANAAFWISSPVSVSIADKGANAALEHPAALLNGAIEFDFFDVLNPGSQSASGTAFPLYQNRGDARTGPPGPEVPYAFRFTGPAGELSTGAPVRLLGFQVGAVKSVRLELSPLDGKATTWVAGVLYPRKLQIEPPAGAGSGATSAADWQRATDAVVNALLATGHRAQLTQSPPLIGGRAISLDAVRAAGPPGAALGAARLIPSVDSSGGIDDITAQINQLLDRINRVPIEGIGQDVRQITTRLNGLLASPALASSLTHLDSALAQTDRMIGEVSPQVGPLVAKLNRVADELTGTVAAARGLLGGASNGGSGGSAAAGADTSLPAAIQELSDAARSIRGLADYLGRHPEALLRGRGDDASNDGASGNAPKKDGR